MNTKKTMQIRQLTITAILAAIAAILMHFEAPIPPFPPFLKLDFSTSIVLMGGFIVGPLAVIPIALTKALVSLLTTTSAGVGQLADFIVTVSFALPFAFIYKKLKSMSGIFIGCAVGAVCIVIAGAIANAYILIPFYSATFPLDAIWGLCKATNAEAFAGDVFNMGTYILFVAIPFNLIKGVIISVVTVILFKALARIPVVRPLVN